MSISGALAIFLLNLFFIDSCITSIPADMGSRLAFSATTASAYDAATADTSVIDSSKIAPLDPQKGA